jgi:prephenate dehydrogenase
MIGVIGLGLIGGSMAKALNQSTDNAVYGFDTNPEVVQRAKLVNAIEEELTPEMIPLCDLVIIALYPEATREVLTKYAGAFKKDAIVMDTCGVKGTICPVGESLAKENGFYFIGGHPMAGLEHSGFEYARKALFSNASMILVPPTGTPIAVVDRLKKLMVSIGFTNVQITTPEEHDRMIAFTSQLAHVVSSAYIKSPTAANHDGFSAGSYKDLTRVAKLNEGMWTELFLENPDNLADEIDAIIKNLQDYSDAIRGGDAETLCKLLREGRLRKEEIDNERF